jgi:cobalt-precorrin 5A hydrolase
MSMIQLLEGQIPVIQKRTDFAIVAITKHGVELARNLQVKISHADLYYMGKFKRGDEETRNIQLFDGSVRMLFPALFPVYKGLIIIISLGAVIRMIAPLLKDKKVDPGIVVIDDKGEHVISVLSGHLGGANELTLEVAAAIGARPVITTASDVQKTIAVDLFGRRFGWQWDPDSEHKLTPVSAAVVNEEKIVVVQESGERNWWLHSEPMPAYIHVLDDITEALLVKPNAALVVTHRILQPEEASILDNGVLYRPKVLVIGMGCNRGTAREEIEAVILEELARLQFSIHSVKALCTIDLKQDEIGLIEVCQKYGWEKVCYTAEQLNKVKLEAPSETVFKYTGAYAVSEPAAKLYSGNEKLLVNKKKSGNVTLSLGLLQHL